jgi:hypothetical protein
VILIFGAGECIFCRSELLLGKGDGMQTCLVLVDLVLILEILPFGRCFNHWVVTEEGRIEHQVD